MSNANSTNPVLIDRTDLDANKISFWPAGTFVFRDRNNVQNRQQLHTVAKLMSPMPLTNATEVATFNAALECIGVLQTPWDRSHAIDKTYDVSPNLTSSVAVLLKNKGEEKINFGKKMYVTRKGVDEVGIPKECFVAHPVDLADSVLIAGSTSVEYNKRTNRTVQIQLHIETK